MDRLRSRTMLIGCAVLLGGGLGYWWLSQSAVAPPVAVPATTEAPRAASIAAAEVVVDVVGAVRSPGVVQLPAGARVQDAVNAAGGVKPGKSAGVNLARRLVDGEQIVVGQSGSSGGATGTGLLNLNSATAAQLESLPGIGPVLANRIIDYRQSHGPFRTVRDLDNVSGVGPAVLAELTKLVAVG